MKNLKIVIEVDKKTGAIKAVEKEFTQLDGTVRKTSKTIDSTTRQLAKFAAGFVGFSAAINTVRDAFDTFRELDTLIGDIAKTTGLDRTSQQLGDLVGQLDRLATSKAGFVVQDLYEIAAGAGQLGIAKKDIVKFTETVEKLKMTTDLTAEEASRDFARIANVLKEPISDIDRLGSVFNELSNTTTATVRDLLYFTQRIGSNAKQFGMTTAEIVGLSAAMKDMSINFEVGGSAFSRTIAQMQAKSKTFANEMKVDADQFAKMMKEKPMAALELFLQKLHELEGGAKYDFLKKLGLGGTETATVLLNISNNLELVRKNIAIANAEYQKGTSLEKEYQQASKSVDSALATLNSTIDVFEKQMLMKFKDPMVSAISTTSEFVQSMMDGTSGIESFVTAAAAGTATFYAFMNAGRVMAFVGSINALTASLTAATAAQRALNIAMKANPLVLGATAAAGAVALMTKNYKDHTAALEEMHKKQLQWAKEREAAGLDAFGNPKISKQAALGNAYVSVYQSDLDEATKQRQLLAIKEQILATTQKTAEEQAKTTKAVKNTTEATKAQKQVDEEWAAAVEYTKSVTENMFQTVYNNIDTETEAVATRYDAEQQMVYAVTDTKQQAHQQTMSAISQEMSAMNQVIAAAQQASAAVAAAQRERDALLAPNFAGMSLGRSSSVIPGNFGHNRALAEFGYTADGIGGILDKFRSPEFLNGLKVIGGLLFGKKKVTAKGYDVGENLSSMQRYTDYKKSGLFVSKRWTEYEPLSAYEQRYIKDIYTDYDFLLNQLNKTGDMFIEAGRYDNIYEQVGINFTSQVSKTTYDVWKEYTKSMIGATEDMSAEELAAATDEAISKALHGMLDFEHDFTRWWKNRNNEDTLEYDAKRLKKEFDDLAAAFGITGLNVDNFRERFEKVQHSMNPYELEKWEKLGNLLMAATDAADAYAKKQAEILEYNLAYEKAYKDSLIEQQKEMQAALQETVREVYDFTRSLRDIVDSSRSIRDTIANIGLSDNQSVYYYIQKVNETEEQFMSYFDSSGHLLDGKFDEMKATYDIQKSYLQTVANSADILGDKERYLKNNMLDLLDKNDMLLNANAKAMEVSVIGGTLTVERFSELIGLNEDQKQQLITTANNLTIIKGSSAQTVAQLSSQYDLTDAQKAEIAEMAADNKITLAEISAMKTATVEQKERIFGISSANSLTVGEMDSLVAANQALYKGDPIDVSNITQARISGYAKDTTVNTLYKGDPVSVSNMIPAVETGLMKDQTFEPAPTTVGVSNITSARTDVSALARESTQQGLYKGQNIGITNTGFAQTNFVAPETGLLKDTFRTSTYKAPYSTVGVSNITSARTDVSALARESTQQGLYKGTPITANNSSFANLLDIKQNTQPLATGIEVDNSYFPYISNLVTLTDEQKEKIVDLTGQNELLTEKVSTDQTLTYVEKWSRLMYEKQIADDAANSTPLGAYSFEATDNYATLGTQEKIDFSNLTGTKVDSAQAEELYNFAKGFSTTNDDLGYFKTQLGATATGLTNTTKLNAYNALYDVLPTDARDAGHQYAQEIKSKKQEIEEALAAISSSYWWYVDSSGAIKLHLNRGSVADNYNAMNAEATSIHRELRSIGINPYSDVYNHDVPWVDYGPGYTHAAIAEGSVSTAWAKRTDANTAYNQIKNMKFFANGGILEHGVYSEPTIAVFAEAGQREAFVPLPDGRNIPVKIQNDTTAQETRALRQQMEELIQLNRKLLRTIQEWDEHGLKTQEIAS